MLQQTGSEQKDRGTMLLIFITDSTTGHVPTSQTPPTNLPPLLITI